MESVGLKFEEIKKIQFGDLKVLPKMDTELELRVRAIDTSSQEGISEAKDVLSSCFGDEYKSQIKAFMDANMRPVNLSVLQAYLLGGDQAVEMILNSAVNMGAKK